MQTATILKFPQPKPASFILQMMQLDVAAQVLKERGFKANARIYPGPDGKQVARLSTDAHGPDLTAAFAQAHIYICEFLVEVEGVKPAELPHLSTFQPSEKINARSGYKRGHVIGWGE